MKASKTVQTIEKSIAVCVSLVLMIFVIATARSVLADDEDELPNYGVRAIRITNACDPQIPAPTAAGSCATVHPNANWSFDISWFDPLFQKYYLADRDNKGIDIIDTTTDKVLGVAAGFVGVQPGTNTSGPNGVVITHKPDQLWAGNGNSHVLVYNLNNDGLPTSSTPIADINTGGSRRADELAYDPDDQLILVANDDDADLFLTFISVSSNPSKINIVGTPISLKPEATGCGIEQPVYDHATRRFYVAVPCTSTNTNGEIAVIDPKTKALEKVYALPTSGPSAGCFPHGLTLGPRENLLVGCSGDNPTAGAQIISLIIEATTGNILATFDQVGGSDEVWYNPGDNHYYLAASSWTATGKIGGPANPVLGIIDAGAFNSGAEGPQWIQNIKTTGGAHSVAAVFVPKNHGKSGKINEETVTRNRIYVPLRVTTTETGGIGVVGLIP